jgi:hypothetical protein
VKAIVEAAFDQPFLVDAANRWRLLEESLERSCRSRDFSHAH